MLSVIYIKGQPKRVTDRQNVMQAAREYAIRNIDKAVLKCDPKYREEVRRRLLIKYNLI